MLRNLTEVGRHEEKSRTAGADRRLQAILWALWTLVVVAAGFIHWRMDVAANQPANLLGIAIYAALTGTIGLVVLTMIEIWLEPQRFVD
jgi:membrane associated rhomboid family serine protease